MHAATNQNADLLTAPATQTETGVSLRSLVFGMCLVLAISALATVVRYILHSSFMAYSHMPMGNLMLTLLSTMVCSILARAFGRRFMFSPSEWIVIFSMGFVSSLGPTYGVSGYLVGLIVTPYYFGTPENRWEEFLHPYLPEWIIPSNQDGAMTWFYDGLPAGAPVPWAAWVGPLFWWMTLVCAIALAGFCASVIMRKQWMEHEKLVYPAMEPIIEITTHAGTGENWMPGFMHGRLFWAGFVLVSVVFGWNMVVWFQPALPSLPTADGTWVPIGRNFPPQWVFISTVGICFSYFASLEVLFSLWFFDLFFTFEAGILDRFGIVAFERYYAAKRYSWQTTGAFVALSLWWMLIARTHLKKAFYKALRPENSDIDDSQELVSYRTAFLGLAVSTIYAAAWLLKAGIALKVVVILLPAMFLVYGGVSKILADSGLIYVNSPTSAWVLTTAILGGASAIPAATHAMMYPASVAINHFRGFTFSVGTHLNRLADLVKGDKKPLFGGLATSFVVGIVASTLFTIWLGYRIGGYNFEPNWLIIRAGEGGYQGAVNAIVSPELMESIDYWFFLIGAGAMSSLLYLRYRFISWPLHPIGLALSGTMLARLTSSTIFVAWLIKFILLRIGGAPFYRRSRPFFIGMLVAYILATAAGLIVDAIWFMPQGHTVHKWY
jgi:hypothetical protein